MCKWQHFSFFNPSISAEIRIIIYIRKIVPSLATISQGGLDLKDYIEERAIEIANYIIESGSTVREAAKVFKVSKSTVHKDVSERLPKINPVLWEAVRKILEQNKAERHIRGGRATKIKYKMTGKK